MATMKEACREEEDAHGPVVHSCPSKGSDIMPCCGKTPFDIPRWHRLSTKPELVNCDRMKLLAEIERLRGVVERLEQFIEASANRVISVGDNVNGYPCPKDGVTLALLKGGAWCPECHTVWRDGLEVDLGAALEAEHD